MGTELRATAPSIPTPHLGLAVTGHRAAHPLVAANTTAIEATLRSLFETIAGHAEHEASDGGPHTARLHCMLADGVDQLAATAALDRGWALVAPLPFGADLYCALNVQGPNLTDFEAMLAGRAPADAAAATRFSTLHALLGRAQSFELCDADGALETLARAALSGEGRANQAALNALVSTRVALAARIMVEQSDLLVAVWDGVHTGLPGGTSHTIETALAMGASVLHIPPDRPDRWRIVQSPEELLVSAAPDADDHRDARLSQIIRDALKPGTVHRHSGHHGHTVRASSDISALDAEHWRPRSNPLWHAYRRIEAIFGSDGRTPRFGSLKQVYETPQTYVNGQGASTIQTLRGAPGADAAFCERVATSVLPRFVWADAIGSRLSDTYRGGMMINFTLSALAVIGGVAYLPVTDAHGKWLFAIFELALLSAILLITFVGQRQHWHARWFETRRTAEYLRHAPILLALGAARAPGRWPRGVETSWPEWYARHALREVGLPRIRVTPAFLRYCLRELLDRHVVDQRNYHRAKAQRLTNVHHNLDQFSERLFQVAVGAVAIFITLQFAEWLGVLDEKTLKQTAKAFTFMGVALPTLGAAVAGVRYFGDFERFAAISEVTAQKLDAVHARMTLLLQADDAHLDYAVVANLAHAADDIVVSEIESWQAVFGGKQITIPV